MTEDVVLIELHKHQINSELKGRCLVSSIKEVII
jgi:hypothetical protein